MPDTTSCPRCGVALLEPEDDSSCPACLLALALDSDETRPGTGHSLDPISDHLPTLPPHYRLESRVGSGGMGLVYRAVDTRLNRPVAIKAVHDARLLEPGASARFRAEALAAASLDHPFICKVYELLESGRKALLVMEFVEGETLAGILRQGRPPLSRTVELISEIAEGLANAHAMGLVHRDIKPSNVMVTPHGHVKLLDFGLARAEVLSDAASTTRATGMDGDARAGTPHYMAPEQAEGKPITARADIFSLGVVAFECIAGELPFDGATEYIYVHALIHDSPKSLAKLAPGTPKELVRLVERCLSKDPAQRPESAAAVALELRQIAETSVAPTAHTLRAASLARSRNRWAWAAVASLVATTAIGWLIVSTRQSSVDRIEVRLASLVTWPSQEGESRSSPDGKFVSFISSLDGTAKLLVQPIAGGEAQAVELPPGHIASQVWSPDGARLAVLVRSASQSHLHIVPAGTSSDVASKFAFTDTLNARLLRWVGNFIYFQADERPTGDVFVTALRRMNVESGHVDDVNGSWRASDPPLPTGFFRGFDVSPDGRRVVFVWRMNEQTDLWAAHMDGTTRVRLTNDAYVERRPIWVGRQDAVIYQSNRGGQFDLWEVSIHDQRSWQRTTGPSQEIPGGASADGSVVTFDHVSEDANLWVAQQGTLRQLNAGAQNDFAPSVSTDGRTLVFQRSRPDASEAVALMSTLLMEGQFDGSKLSVNPTPISDGFAATISPDGTHVAFMQRSGAQPQSLAALQLTNLKDRKSQRLSDACPLPFFALSPNVWISPALAWTADSRDLYFIERRADPPSYVIKRFRRDSGGSLSTIVEAPAGSRIRDLYLVDDDRFLAFLTFQPSAKSGIHLFDLESNKDRKVIDLDPLASLRGWTRPGRFVVLRAHTSIRPTTVDVVTLDVSGNATVIGQVENVYPQTARLDGRSSRLYFTRVEDGAQNLYAMSLDGGGIARVTANSFPNVSFVGVESLPDESALFARDEWTHDIWILRRSRAGVR